jgi:hypothetical protein
MRMLLRAAALRTDALRIACLSSELFLSRVHCAHCGLMLVVCCFLHPLHVPLTYVLV